MKVRIQVHNDKINRKKVWGGNRGKGGVELKMKIKRRKKQM